MCVSYVLVRLLCISSVMSAPGTYQISDKHPGVPREVVLHCRHHVGILIVGDKGDTLKVRTGFGPYVHWEAEDFLQAAIGRLDSHWKVLTATTVDSDISQH